MLIVLGVYFGLVWLVFSKLKLLPWNIASKSVVYLGGLVIALVVIGALNHTTPSGPVSVQGAVINIAPNVSGPVTEVNAVANQPAAKGDVLFVIDDTVKKAEVARLQASVASAQTYADQLLTDREAAIAEIASLNAQLDFGIQRRDDIIDLSNRGAAAEFQLQEAVSTIEQLEANIRAAEARKASLDRRVAAKIDGIDVDVVETQQALAQAQWELEQTVVRAPADGLVTGLSLRVGNRASPLQGALNFIVPEDRTLFATLPQSSAPNVGVGNTIRVALGTMPGREFDAQIQSIIPATAEGAVDARSGLPSLRELSGASSYIVSMQVPESVSLDAARLGASGTALIITEEAGAISALAEILFWVAKMMNYL
ncbi:MAG: biotin/lipoyl-binding protein [Tateyamaria sp.]|uniref:HlyD family secretion protein n=2 Tax=Alphaproteobacteria TaxID=28211 RepID=UPI00329D390D